MTVCGQCGNFKRAYASGETIAPFPPTAEDMKDRRVVMNVTVDLEYWCPSCDGPCPDSKPTNRAGLDVGYDIESLVLGEDPNDD